MAAPGSIGVKLKKKKFGVLTETVKWKKKSYLPCSHKGSNWLCEANKFSKQELCKNTRTAIHANFLRSALLKEKDIGARKNKTKQIFCYNSKKQGGFDYFKTKTDSLAIVKEINFLSEIH